MATRALSLAFARFLLTAAVVLHATQRPAGRPK